MGVDVARWWWNVPLLSCSRSSSSRCAHGTQTDGPAPAPPHTAPQPTTTHRHLQHPPESISPAEPLSDFCSTSEWIPGTLEIDRFSLPSRFKIQAKSNIHTISFMQEPGFLKIMHCAMCIIYRSFINIHNLRKTTTTWCLIKSVQTQLYKLVLDQSKTFAKWVDQRPVVRLLWPGWARPRPRPRPGTVIKILYTIIDLWPPPIPDCSNCIAMAC